MAEAAVLLAMALVLNALKLFTLPQGRWCSTPSSSSPCPKAARWIWR